MNDTVYHQHAKHLAATLGLENAILECKRSRNQNTMGAFTYGFYVAVLKVLESMARSAA